MNVTTTSGKLYWTVVDEHTQRQRAMLLLSAKYDGEC